MTITPEEVQRIFSDPWDFISRLTIKDKTNVYHGLNVPWPEQIPWLQALFSDKKYNLGLKPRQVGYTTYATAYEFWRTYTSKSPRLVLQVVNDEDTRDRVRDMVNVFREELPPAIRGRFARGHDNDKRSLFDHNQAGFHRRVAGAKGKARSATFNDLHATEMAHWAEATSAARRSQAGTADEEMFASAMATMHDEAGRVIVESTGNGPRGLFYKLWQQARTDPAWNYVFVSWRDVPRYRVMLTDIEKRALEQDLDDTERALLHDRGLDLEQLAWRRRKIRTERWEPMRFRYEYPLTDMEPFMFSEDSWFDQEKLAKMLDWASDVPVQNHLRLFAKPEKGMRYVMGVDTAGGVGRDEAVITILDITMRHVAIWATNRAGPAETALMVSRLGGLYNRPLCLIEANHFGEEVITRVAELGGVELWKDDDDKDFYTTGGRAGHSKRAAMVHARELILDDWAAPLDAETIHQLQMIVEKENGKIEGRGETHDDRAMAWVLALYGGRKLFRKGDLVKPPIRDTLPGLKQVRETMGRGDGGR